MKTLLLASLLLLSASEPTTAQPTTPTPELMPETYIIDTPDTSPSDPIQRYLQQANEDCTASLIDAGALQLAIQNLLNNAQPESLELARERWLSAQQSWLHCAIYRFIGGPLGRPLNHDPFTLYQRLGSWPISAGYIDSLPNYPFSGIVNSPSSMIKRQSLLNQHRATAPNEASVGLYVMEVLLFGSDGLRSFEEYLIEPVDVAKMTDERVDYHQRRRTYLHIVSALYRDDLKFLLGQLDPEQAAFPRGLRQLPIGQQQELLQEGLQQQLLSLHIGVSNIQQQLPDHRLSNSWPQRLLQPLIAIERLQTAISGLNNISTTPTTEAEPEALLNAIKSADQLQPPGLSGHDLDNQLMRLQRELKTAIGTTPLFNHGANQ